MILRFELISGRPMEPLKGLDISMIHSLIPYRLANPSFLQADPSHSSLFIHRIMAALGAPLIMLELHLIIAWPLPIMDLCGWQGAMRRVLRNWPIAAMDLPGLRLPVQIHSLEQKVR